MSGVNERSAPRTSVICSVWHGDENRHALLRTHQENLARQSVPVIPIYVFDGADPPPDWLAGEILSSRAPLTIYQAWNVALARVETPLVMNLNLDDRLAPDAVETLERELLQQGAALIGGDWNICYSQAETDAVAPCHPVGQKPLVEGWPPIPGKPARLGSGTGENRSLGPATLWRMETHVGVPRYPWRFSDGSLIRVAGDTAWWLTISAHLRKKIARLPLVIGNYHSHPGSQAEFRAGTQDEIDRLDRLGVARY